MRKSSKHVYWWENLSDNELLELRFCDLKLKLSHSPISRLIEKLNNELANRGLKFKPHCWISEEWFSADGIPGIAIPFFVVNQRLSRLEKKMVFEVEGATDRECLKLLRHETGHAIDNAYRLRRSKMRQEMFGLSSTVYPDNYSPKAYSKKYVVHLNSWYAQAHPDEDWAETFAVWLNPKSKWKQKYRHWPALEKLKLVDEMMEEIAGRRPPVTNKDTLGDVTKSRKKIKTYYKEKRESFGVEQPFYLDPLLLRLFSSETKYKSRKSAAMFIRQERALIRRLVARWTGQYQYTINLLLQEVIESCREKKLYLTRSERETRMDLVGMLTAQTLNYITSGNHKIPM